MFRWIFERDQLDVQVRIIWFPDHNQANRNAEIIFNAKCTLDHLARAIIAGFRRLQHEIGERSYEGDWGFPFPAHEIAAVDQARRSFAQLS
ncbi:hypothetical protein [Microtetraspora malaysiensis]|uniref:hypothetical protein n=1 Tax=Microtetraspora malaysiensis TaxID=161358 RepID=UPI0012FC8D57|nr:hypothetical protein [Microtetraspora malaysiensis]